MSLKGAPLVGLLPRIRKDPLGLMLEASRHGDVVKLDLGFRFAWQVNEPDLIKLILQDRRANYPKSVLYEKMRPALGNGLIMSEGETWATQRRLIQPAFSHARLEPMARLMVAETQARLGGLSESARAGRAVDMAAEMSALTLSIVVKAMFGTELKDDMAVIAEAVEVLNEHSNNRFHRFIDPPLWVPTPRNLRARWALRHLDSIVYRLMKERRAAASTAGQSAAASQLALGPSALGETTEGLRAGKRPQDLLDMLLNARNDDGAPMSDVQIRDEVMTIFLAGHETTATSLAWTLNLLAGNPAAEETLRRELESLGDRDPGFADLQRLPYLKMVLEESMRIKPPVWSFSRTAAGPDTLGSAAIPKGALVFVCPWSMHRDPRWWDDPEAFRPERFAPDQEAKRPRYAYFPFGGGPRMCIGNGFSMTEGALVLACLLRRFRFRMRSQEPVGMKPLVTLRPKGGMWMTVSEESHSLAETARTT